VQDQDRKKKSTFSFLFKLHQQD